MRLDDSAEVNGPPLILRKDEPNFVSQGSLHAASHGNSYIAVLLLLVERLSKYDLFDVDPDRSAINCRTLLEVRQDTLSLLLGHFALSPISTSR